MEQTVESATRYRGISEPPVANNEARASGVSWPAVIAGAFVAAALSLILIALGSGLGFPSVSVWSNVGASASTIGMAAVLSLIVMQIISAAMGGYLAGRLRTKWANIHTDEVYFSDSAHGCLGTRAANGVGSPCRILPYSTSFHRINCERQGSRRAVCGRFG